MSGHQEDGAPKTSTIPSSNDEAATSSPEIAEYTKAGLKMVVTANRLGSLLPSGAARDAYSACPSYMKVIEHESSKILNLLHDVLRTRNIRGNIARRDDDEEKLEMLLECNDMMLESINSSLDEVAGIKKVPTEVVLVESAFRAAPENRGPLSGSWNEGGQFAKMHKTARLLTARNIVRPQLHFKVPVDNSNTPFEPRIKDKPHSLKPLAILPEYDDAGNVEAFLHPYDFELNKFEPPAELLCKVEVQPLDSLPSMADTRFDFIATEAELRAALEELRHVKEIAVDLEHHSYRSFQGITCLMQLSTRDHDFILDTLALREELHLLNEVFADPRIVKVFHGADCDIEWLQRDLGLYVVNLFDTHQAAKRLNFARLSLAFLLKHYCNVDADKSFQLADWRIRPLPQELIHYARQDTHYLLPIYDVMRNELLKASAHGDANLLRAVYQAGVQLCRRRYMKPRLFADSHLELYRHSKKRFDNRQLYALQHLFAWRDAVARQEDESTGYVLPNHMVLHIAEHLPREMQGVLACCNPVPPLVRQNLHQLHQILLKAREQPLVTKVAVTAGEKPVVVERSSSSRSNVNHLLYCPHDTSHEADFRDDLPTLLGRRGAEGVTVSSSLKRKHSRIELLESSEDDEEENGTVDDKKLAKLRDIKFITPYARFLSILPLAEAEERQEHERAAQEAKKRKLCPTPMEMEQQQKAVKRKADEGEVEEEEKQQQEKDKAQPPSKKKRWLKDKVQSFRQMMAPGTSKAQNGVAEQTPTTPITPQQNKKNKLTKSQKWKAKQARWDSPQQGKAQETPASSSKNDFDYSKIDYSKFQGGSTKDQKGQKQQQFDSKFKTRGQKAKNADKKFNKMFSFSKVAQKK